MKTKLYLAFCIIGLLGAAVLAQEHQIHGFFDATPSNNPFFAPPVVVPAGSTAAIDWGAGLVQTRTLAANTTFTFANAQTGQAIEVYITNTVGNYTVTWPTVSWPGGSAPTQTVGAHVDKYVFRKVGSTYYGFVTANF